MTIFDEGRKAAKDGKVRALNPYALTPLKRMIASKEGITKEKEWESGWYNFSHKTY